MIVIHTAQTFPASKILPGMQRGLNISVFYSVLQRASTISKSGREVTGQGLLGGDFK